MAKKEPFFQAFKKFITRGNVIDTAVGVVIGGSFGKIVSGLVNYVINPFVGLFVKSGDMDSIKTVITREVTEIVDGVETVVTPEVAILWGKWFQTILDFLITAFCIFVVLRIIMSAKEAMEADKIAAAEAKAKAEAEKAKAEKEAADAAAAEAAAALAKRQEELDRAILNQEKLLGEIKTLLEKKG